MKNLVLMALVLGLGAVYLTAGQWAMIAALIVMVTVHELGHWVVARSLGIKAPVFSIGMFSAPRVVLFKVWGTEFQITPWLFGGFVQIDIGDDDFVNRPARQRLAVMVAGVVMNMLLAFAIVAGTYATMGEQSVRYEGAFVQDFPAAVSIARDAGMQAGDRFIAIDGISVTQPDDLRNGLAKHADGSAADLTLERNGQQIHQLVTPDKDGHIGIFMGSKVVVEYNRMNPLQAVSRGASATWEMSTRMIHGLAMMVGLEPMPAGLPAGSDQVHGIVAIVQIGDMALNNGLYSFLMLTALISINFAVMNILPVPVLDGGHIMFIGLEKLFGRRINPAIQNVLTLVFAALLMGLMVYGLINDIVNPISFK